MSTVSRLEELTGPTGLRRQIAGYAVAGLLQGTAIAALVPILRALGSADPAAAVAWLAGSAAAFAGYAVVLARTNRRGDRIGVYTVSDRLAKLLAARVVQLPLGWFGADRTGSLAVRVRAAQEIGGYPAMVLQQVTGALSTPLPVLVAAAVVDWRAALAFVVLTPLGLLAFRWIRRSTRPAREEEAAALTEVADRVLEFARAQPVLRATGSTGTGLANLDAGLRADRHATLRVLSRQSHPGLAYALVVQTGLALGVLVACLLLTAGTIDPAAGAALLVLAVRFAEPLTLAGFYGTGLQVAANGLRGIREVVGTPALPEPERPREPAGAGIEFSDVTFGYPGGDPVLRGFSLVCAPGTMTALVGPSGAGKTTVTRLVARFFDVDAGAVRIGGTDVRDMTTATLMRQVAMVFQDVYLFDATIEENVRLGLPDATDAEVRAAARAARLDEVVERLPLGWATTVGEAGGRLSGGERQRVSIARALLKDAPVVLLDEITAALDVENEAAVAEALGRLAGDRTVLVVAHRLTTIAAADRIAVLADGGIAELGTHSELAAAGGRYAGYLAPAVRAHPAEDPR